MRMGRIGSAALLAALAAAGAAQEPVHHAEPAFTIWDVELGTPVSAIPETEVAEIACGTNGGPISTPLARFSEFLACAPEPSGLREVHFAHDDEMQYVARALSNEFEFLQDGTTVYSQPVLLSVLVDGEGIAQGIRIVTDPRVRDRERRRAPTLIRNFESRFGAWRPQCTELPPAEGEEPAGNFFLKTVCTAVSPDGSATLRLDASYLRKRGQEPVNTETRTVNTGYFEAYSRLELVRAPYVPAPPPGR
jgi:hypothetical protein